MTIGWIDDADVSAVAGTGGMRKESRRQMVR